MPKLISKKETFDYLPFANALKRAIRKKGLSYGKLADRLDMSKNSITQMCMGERLTRIPTLINICIALDITPDYLLMPYLSVTGGQTEDEYHKLLMHLGKLRQNELNMLYGIVDIIVKNRK